MWASAALLVIAFLGAGCGADSTPTSTSNSTPKSAPATSATDAPFRILVANDDGYDAPGIAAVVHGLQELPGVHVTVSAPAKNQSGTSDRMTQGTVTAEQKATADGYPAAAVDGYPADAVTYGLDELKARPDLVITGINAGQNLGPTIEISGTIGGARTAARRHVPALAVSLGLREDETPSTATFATAVRLTKEWVQANRARILQEERGTGTIVGPVRVVSINVPSCANVRGLVQTPTASVGDGRDLVTQDCGSTRVQPKDDIEAFNNGYATQSDVEAGVSR